MAPLAGDGGHVGDAAGVVPYRHRPRRHGAHAARGAGADALDATQRFHGAIHLLLADVVMPEMGGRELAGRLGQARPQMKVLHVSGYAADAIVHQNVLRDTEAFLSKPLRADALLRKVRQLLDAPQAGVRG